MIKFFSEHGEFIAAAVGTYLVTLWCFSVIDLPMWVVLLNTFCVGQVVGQWSERFLLRIEKRRQL